MVKITPIQTGLVRVRTAQRRRRAGGLIRVLLDREWTEWLPILAWIIEHPEGIFVVDTGETSRTSAPGYFPRWHPYYLLGCEMEVARDEEIGPQLLAMGIRPGDIKALILTHLHTDHAGGLHHFQNVKTFVEKGEYRSARGIRGRLQGYLPNRWPEWFAPLTISFDDDPVGSFKECFKLTKEGDLLVVPTPGHTPNHVSVIVRTEDADYFLAGDTSYTQQHLTARQPDGISPSAKRSVETIDRILKYARSRPTVYLPTHDPESIFRLESKSTVFELAEVPANGLGVR